MGRNASTNKDRQITSVLAHMGLWPLRQIGVERGYLNDRPERSVREAMEKYPVSLSQWEKPLTAEDPLFPKEPWKADSTRMSGTAQRVVDWRKTGHDVIA